MHPVSMLASFATTATMSTHRLLSWVGILKGSKYFDICISILTYILSHIIAKSY